MPTENKENKEDLQMWMSCIVNCLEEHQLAFLLKAILVELQVMVSLS